MQSHNLVGDCLDVLKVSQPSPGVLADISCSKRGALGDNQSSSPRFVF